MKNEESNGTRRVGIPEWQQTKLAKRQKEREVHPVAHRILALIEKILPLLAGLFCVGIVIVMGCSLSTGDVSPTEIAAMVVVLVTTTIVPWCWYTICSCFGYHFFFCKSHLRSFIVGAMMMLFGFIAVMVSGKTLVTFERLTVVVSVLYVLVCSVIVYWNLFLPYWYIMSGKD